MLLFYLSHLEKEELLEHRRAFSIAFDTFQKSPEFLRGTGSRVLKNMQEYYARKERSEKMKETKVDNSNTNYENIFPKYEIKTFESIALDENNYFLDFEGNHSDYSSDTIKQNEDIEHEDQGCLEGKDEEAPDHFGKNISESKELIKTFLVPMIQLILKRKNSLRLNNSEAKKYPYLVMIKTCYKGMISEK